MDDVAMWFKLAHGADIRRHIPRMGRSPEIEDSAPATVVIFAGKVQIGPMMLRLPAPGESLAPEPDAYAGVVCVFHDGVPEFYSDVDTTGATP
jgi:hypothetical protein